MTRRNMMMMMTLLVLEYPVLVAARAAQVYDLSVSPLQLPSMSYSVGQFYVLEN